jgi:hypothetical protein
VYSYYISLFLTLTNKNFVHEEMKSGLISGNESPVRYISVYLPVCFVRTWSLEQTDAECGSLRYMDMKSRLSHEGKIIG